jgi:hypothetical protein
MHGKCVIAAAAVSLVVCLYSFLSFPSEHILLFVRRQFFDQGCHIFFAQLHLIQMSCTMCKKGKDPRVPNPS